MKASYSGEADASRFRRGETVNEAAAEWLENEFDEWWRKYGHVEVQKMYGWFMWTYSVMRYPKSRKPPTMMQFKTQTGWIE